MPDSLNPPNANGELRSPDIVADHPGAQLARGRIGSIDVIGENRIVEPVDGVVRKLDSMSSLSAAITLNTGPKISSRANVDWLSTCEDGRLNIQNPWLRCFGRPPPSRASRPPEVPAHEFLDPVALPPQPPPAP